MPDAVLPVNTVPQKHHRPHYLHPKLKGVRLEPGGPLLDPATVLKQCMSYRVAKDPTPKNNENSKGKKVSCLSHVGRSTFERKVICVFTDDSLGAKEIDGWLYNKGTGKNPRLSREGAEPRNGALPAQDATLEAVSADAISNAGIKVLPILAIANRTVTKKERQYIQVPKESSMLRLVLDPFRFHDYDRVLRPQAVDTARRGGSMNIKYPLSAAKQAFEEYRRNRQFQSKKKVSFEEALALGLEDLAQSAGRMLALGATTSVKMKDDDITLGWLADLDEVKIGFGSKDGPLLDSIERLAGDLAHRKVKANESYNWGATYAPVKVAKKLVKKKDREAFEARLKERFRKAFYRGYEASKGKTIKFSRKGIAALDGRDIEALLGGYVLSGELRRDRGKAELIAFMEEKGHLDDSVPNGLR